MEALNRKYKKLADQFMGEKESEKDGWLKDYYDLRTEAEQYYPSQALLSKNKRKLDSTSIKELK